MIFIVEAPDAVLTRGDVNWPKGGRAGYLFGGSTYSVQRHILTRDVPEPPATVGREDPIMDITALHASPAADAAVSEITRYGLEHNVVELDAYGFTVIPPEKTAAAPGFVERLRDAILRTHGARNDDPIDDYRTAELKAGFRNSWWLLEEDEAFVEAVLNPAALAIARWMCGQSAVMTGATWLLKGATRLPGSARTTRRSPSCSTATP